MRHARRGGGLEGHEARADSRSIHRMRRRELRRALDLDLDELRLLLRVRVR